MPARPAGRGNSTEMLCGRSAGSVSADLVPLGELRSSSVKMSVAARAEKKAAGVKESFMKQKRR